MSFPAHSGPEVAAPPAPAEPHFSLLRLSAGQRVVGASLVLVLLWLAVWWAL